MRPAGTPPSPTVEDPWAKSSDGVASSLFAKGPAQLEGLDAAKAWTLDDDLPGEAASLKCLYGPTDNCAVWPWLGLWW